MGTISGLISLLCIVAVSSLGIGDASPSLDGIQWFKGKAPVFKNQVTIIEIWRTSCPNCKAQIPHMTSLQKKYGDRISIVALSKEPSETIEEFIKVNGDQMGYAIGRVTKELSAATYFTDLKGVPYSYIINKDGVIVWRGHPATIDDMLAKTVEGTIDVEKLKEIYNLETSLNELLNVNNPEAIAPIDEKLLLIDPSNEKGLEVGMTLAVYNDDPAMIKSLYDKIPLTGLPGGKANSFALALVSESDLAYRYPEAALKFSVYALKQEPENDIYMDVYARVLYCLGDIDKATLWQKKAIALNPKESDYQSHLNYYLSLKNIREKNDYNAITPLQDSKTKK
jgi:thiol-disulfide isomerase/thioredoxin